MRAMQPHPPTHRLRWPTRTEDTYTRQKSVGKRGPWTSASTERAWRPAAGPPDGPGRGAYPLDNGIKIMTDD